MPPRVRRPSRMLGTRYSLLVDADHVVDGGATERARLPLVPHIMGTAQARAAVSTAVENRICWLLLAQQAELRRGQWTRAERWWRRPARSRKVSVVVVVVVARTIRARAPAAAGAEATAVFHRRPSA